MYRLTVLMIEVEQPEGLSSRKLMVEGAKQNVLTAYSGDEGLELFAKNDIHVVVIHSKLTNPGAKEVVEKIRQKSRDIPIIGLSPNDADMGPVTMTISSFEPNKLVEVVKEYARQMLGR
ncbi:MAG TPA: hypothetical protein VN577_16000 [Terriglobales bacterium]|nr:hypothetical protein [Terriglobales bacterium]